jgi:sterol desaturase/sphingolipid hydroxylase (fatty acid hydroxylase superfamily)
MAVVMAVFLAALLMLAVERLAPARRLPKTPRWLGRSLALNGVQVGMVFVGGLTWDRWFPGHSLWDGSRLGTAGGAIVGYLVITFVYYWWHRARHEIPLLWRWVHQVHHSAQRLELITSFYKHPIEIAINGALSSAILYLVVGLTPAAASLAVLVTGIAELFYHWNVATPHWLGYLVQRPESHRVHHQYGRHRNNYSDLPLWDILFGTFENPRAAPEACGFDTERELALGRMLLGHDVHRETRR